MDFHVLASTICLYYTFFLSFIRSPSILTPPKGDENLSFSIQQQRINMWPCGKRHPLFFPPSSVYFLNYTGVSLCQQLCVTEHQTNCFLSLPSITSPNRAIRAERHRHLTIRLQLLIHRDSVTNVTRDYFTKAAVHCGA